MHIRNKLRDNKVWLAVGVLVVFVTALLTRLPIMSSGLDQWDVILYRNSLMDMHFYREAQWPLLLLAQKLLWLMLPGFSAAQILSLTNIVLGAGTVALFFALVYKTTRSVVAGVMLATVLFFIPLFAVYSVVGMQDVPQTFAVTAFVGGLVMLCLRKTPTWLYATAAAAGLAMGVRPTLLLVTPALAVAAMLTFGFKQWRRYAIATAVFIGACLTWFIANQFIHPLAGSNPTSFFWGQFTAFNPAVLGWWTKAGSYALLSGYNTTLFYWLPSVWLLICAVARSRQDTRATLAPILAYVGAGLSLLVVFGLTKALGGNPPPTYLKVEAVVVVVGLIYEAWRFWQSRKGYFKNMDGKERLMLSLAALFGTYFAFNYIFTGPVTRYLLPIIPAMLLFMLLLAGPTKWRIVMVSALIVVTSFLACPFYRAEGFAAAFKNLDPRSTLAQYVREHPGQYYSTTIVSFIQGYGKDVDARVHLLDGVGCTNLDTTGQVYVMFYGPITANIVEACSKYTFNQVAKFQRMEAVIEDSVGNLGFTVYRLQPKAL